MSGQSTLSSNSCKTYNIHPIKAFNDNYIWAIHNKACALVVDPGDANPVFAFLHEHKLTLDTILITHHHADHTGGVMALISAYPSAKVYGPNNPSIKGITQVVAENDEFMVPALNIDFKVLETPGHTLDHIAYVNDELVFCGDTLFSAGCGRMFEGTPEVFYASLQKLAALPGNTKVFCTHEYTQANVKFALHVDGENKALLEYADWVDQQRQKNDITLPSSIAKESAINPFLRCHTPSISQNTLNFLSPGLSEVEVFASLRKAKDVF